MIAGLQRGHAAPDIDDDACAFMTEDHREQALWIGAGARELIRVAHAARLDLDQHLTVTRSFQFDSGDFERLTGGISNCGLGLHGSILVL